MFNHLKSSALYIHLYLYYLLQKVWRANTPQSSISAVEIPNTPSLSIAFAFDAFGLQNYALPHAESFCSLSFTPFGGQAQN